MIPFAKGILPPFTPRLGASQLIKNEPGLEPRYRVILEWRTSSFCPALLRKGVEHTVGLRSGTGGYRSW